MNNDLENTRQEAENIDQNEQNVPPEGMIPMRPQDLFSPVKRRKLTECTVAGWQFHHPDDWWDELYEGAELTLVREKHNVHDRNAVAVVFYENRIMRAEYDGRHVIGYVPRTENKTIATMMDMGWGNAFSAELTTLEDDGPYVERLRMTIYVEPTDEIEHKDDWHVWLINRFKLATMNTVLYEKGLFASHWLYDEPAISDVPDSGDKVLTVCLRGRQIELNLMHVVAMGQDAMPYFDDDDEQDAQINGVPFVLAHLRGPVLATRRQLRCLDLADIARSHPMKRCDENIVRELKNIVYGPDYFEVRPPIRDDGRTFE